MSVAPVKTLVVTTGDDGTPVLAEPIRLVNPDGTPFKGATAPAAGSITNAMLAGGITKDKLAADVVPTVPAAPTADTLSGATEVGRSVLKAADAAAARTAIGVPAAPTWANISGKPAAATAIADLTAAPTAADVNKILAALRSFGIIAK